MIAGSATAFLMRQDPATELGILSDIIGNWTMKGPLVNENITMGGWSGPSSYPSRTTTHFCHRCDSQNQLVND